METKKGLKLDDYGRPVIDSEQFVELLLQGKSVDRLLVDYEDTDIQLYISHQRDLLNKSTSFQTPENKDFEEFHVSRADSWLIPDEFRSLDVKKWLIDRCKTDIQRQRVEEEYGMFCERGLLDLLRFFIFLVSHLRSKNFLWGVGRGSSVSSYILYLIGIHRVDSLKYDLSIKEFLK